MGTNEDQFITIQGFITSMPHLPQFTAKMRVKLVVQYFYLLSVNDKFVQLKENISILSKRFNTYNKATQYIDKRQYNN